MCHCNQTSQAQSSHPVHLQSVLPYPDLCNPFLPALPICPPGRVYLLQEVSVAPPTCTGRCYAHQCFAALVAPCAIRTYFSLVCVHPHIHPSISPSPSHGISLKGDQLAGEISCPPEEPGVISKSTRGLFLACKLWIRLLYRDLQRSRSLSSSLNLVTFPLALPALFSLPSNSYKTPHCPAPVLAVSVVFLRGQLYHKVTSF